MGGGLAYVVGRGNCIKCGLWEGGGDRNVRSLRRLRWREWWRRRHGCPLWQRCCLAVISCPLIARADLCAQESNLAAQLRDVLSYSLCLGVARHLHVPHDVCYCEDAVVVFFVNHFGVVGTPQIRVIPDIPRSDVDLVGLTEVMLQRCPVLIDWIYPIPSK